QRRRRFLFPAETAGCQRSNQERCEYGASARRAVWEHVVRRACVESRSVAMAACRPTEQGGGDTCHRRPARLRVYGPPCLRRPEALEGTPCARVVTLVVFVPFAVFYMKEPLKLDYLGGRLHS